VAFDLIRGTNTRRNWARGDEPPDPVVGGWFWEKAGEEAAKKIPWKGIAITATVALGAFVILPKIIATTARKKEIKKTKKEYESVWPDEPTTQLVNP